MALPLIPCTLVIGELDEACVCTLCHGVLREPRFSTSCSDHSFCKVCYESSLRLSSRCPHPTCTLGAGSLLKFGPFEDLVNRTEVRCPNGDAVEEETADASCPQEAARPQGTTTSSADAATGSPFDGLYVSDPTS